MLTPDAIFKLSYLGFTFDSSPCSVSDILRTIEEARWNSDNDDNPEATETAIRLAYAIVEMGGWRPVAA